MNDRRVSKWAELTDALYDIPETTHGRYRSNFVYRGLADESWGLETSLPRWFEQLAQALLWSGTETSAKVWG